MRNLLRLIYRYYFFLLFILVEFVCFFLIIQYNSFQKSSFLNSSGYITGIIYESFDDITDYLHLKEENRKLASENAQLRNMLKMNFKYSGVRKWEIVDSVYRKQYTYRAAKVINNSVNKQRNYMTIDKGSGNGIQAEMAVISQDYCVLGIIKEVSKNYAAVISIINSNLKISAKIKKNGYFGSIRWDGSDYRMCKLNEIPSHVEILIGDTIVTSGYSSSFPDEILIGKISNIYKDESSSFYDIEVELFNDMSQVSHVYIVENLFKNEIKNIEKLADD